MLRTVLFLFAAVSSTVVPASAEWRLDTLASPGRVTAVTTTGDEVVIAVGASWYRLAPDGAKLEPAAAPLRIAVPAGGLADGTVASGRGIVARAWFAEPTGRYRHGILGDAIEAASLVIERRDGGRAVVASGADAVFEDLVPRLVSIDGAERIVVVRSYLDRGAALAIVDPAAGAIVAETPPVGHANAWLHPVGLADFDGDGSTDIAFVRQPHVLGRLELWSFRDGALRRTAEMADVSTHAIGSRALGMSAVSDFDGDGRPDLAVPSLDRRTLRFIAFAPRPREIARVALPARIVTDIGMVMRRGRLALVAGLENGTLVVLQDGSVRGR